MKLERLLSMKGGKGQDSYANNSQAQVSTSYFFSNYFNSIKKTSNKEIWIQEDYVLSKGCPRLASYVF